MSKFSVKITILLAGLLVALCVCGANFVCVGSAFGDSDKVKIRFVYEGKTWEYVSDQFESENFYFQSIGAKFGRWGSCEQRAKLLGKVKKIGFSARDSLKYVFVGIGEILDKIEKTINRSSKDATYKFNPQNRSLPFSFTAEQVGYEVDFDAILDEITTKLSQNAEVEVEIKPIEIKPNIYLDEIRHFANLRGSFYTTFNSEITNRSNNIAIASKMFDGLVMGVGEEFSFNSITGRRSQEKGYMPAKIIVDKKYVEGFGGGVCQVSTTLYNALLLAGLEIKEVHSHSLISSYVNMGFDAMVNFGSADLRWVNNTDTTLFVQSFVAGNQIHFNIYGTKQPNKFTYKRVTEIEKKFEPPADEIIIDKVGEYADLVRYKDESAYKTLSKHGYRVRAILEKYDGEKLVERKFLRRVNYPAVRGVKVYGFKEREKTEKEISYALDKNTVDFWKNFV